jgi:rod shape determining protein RodA
MAIENRQLAKLTTSHSPLATVLMLKTIRFRDFDWFLLSLAVAIAGVGVLQIYSTTMHSALASQYKKQMYWVLAGCLVALVVSQLDYHIVLELAPWLYVGSVVGLVGLLAAGHRVAGARRWLHLGGLTFQVSEMAKLVIIVGVAAYFAERRDKHVSWKDVVFLGFLAGLPAVLVAVEPDLGTALTFVPIVGLAIFLMGIRARQVAVLGLLGALMLPAGWHFLRPYQRERLKTFVHPSDDLQGSGYQVTQSKIAIGSGGLWGKGVGSGTQSQLGFIPVSREDFILASFAEEQGFIGTLLVLLLYLGLVLRLLDGAQLAGDRAGALLIAGVASVLFFQGAVNAGMLIGLVPTVGVPLPLMSQGGSSVLCTFLGLGLAAGVRMRRLVN